MGGSAAWAHAPVTANHDPSQAAPGESLRRPTRPGGRAPRKATQTQTCGCLLVWLIAAFGSRHLFFLFFFFFFCSATGTQSVFQVVQPVRCVSCTCCQRCCSKNVQPCQVFLHITYVNFIRGLLMVWPGSANWISHSGNLSVPLSVWKCLYSSSWGWISPGCG